MGYRHWHAVIASIGMLGDAGGGSGRGVGGSSAVTTRLRTGGFFFLVGGFSFGWPRLPLTKPSLRSLLSRWTRPMMELREVLRNSRRYGWH